MRYFCLKLPEWASGWPHQQKCRPKCEFRCLSVNAGEAIEGNSLVIACAEGPVLLKSRCTIFGHARKRHKPRVALNPARTTYSLNTATSLACFSYHAFLKAEWGTSNLVIEAQRLKNITCMMHKRMLTSWQRSSQKTRLLRSTAKFLKGSQS